MHTDSRRYDTDGHQLVPIAHKTPWHTHNLAGQQQHIFGSYQ